MQGTREQLWLRDLQPRRGKGGCRAQGSPTHPSPWAQQRCPCTRRAGRDSQHCLLRRLLAPRQRMEPSIVPPHGRGSVMVLGHGAGAASPGSLVHPAQVPLYQHLFVQIRSFLLSQSSPGCPQQLRAGRKLGRVSSRHHGSSSSSGHPQPQDPWAAKLNLSLAAPPKTSESSGRKTQIKGERAGT